MDEFITQDRMNALSTEWRESVTAESVGDTVLTLSSCMQFVKSKMYINRDMSIILNDARRRELCVALHDYTHRIASLSDADVDFVERRETGTRSYTQPRYSPDDDSCALVYI